MTSVISWEIKEFICTAELRQQKLMLRLRSQRCRLHAQFDTQHPKIVHTFNGKCQVLFNLISQSVKQCQGKANQLSNVFKLQKTGPKYMLHFKIKGSLDLQIQLNSQNVERIDELDYKIDRVHQQVKSNHDEHRRITTELDKKFTGDINNINTNQIQHGKLIKQSQEKIGQIQTRLRQQQWLPFQSFRRNPGQKYKGRIALEDDRQNMPGQKIISKFHPSDIWIFGYRYPLLSQRKIEGRQYIELQFGVVHQHNCIGVSTADLFQQKGYNCEQDPHSICLKLSSPCQLILPTKKVKLDYTVQKGHRVRVKVDTRKKTIQWERVFPNKQILAQTDLGLLADKDIFFAAHICSKSMVRQYIKVLDPPQKKQMIHQIPMLLQPVQKQQMQHV